MKTHVRELQGDFKAAARIGNPDSIASVMERVRATADDELSAAALPELGKALAGLPPEILLPWLDDDDPAVRGIAAAAIGHSERVAGQVPDDALRFIADDPVDAVREAFAEAMADGDRIAMFLADESVRVRRTGLTAFARNPELAMRSVDLLSEFDREQDHGLREDLVAALNRLAETGREKEVLDLLDNWAGRVEPNVWVITRIASAGWAQAHSPRCVEILGQLAANAGDQRSITRALERHIEK